MKWRFYRQKRNTNVYGDLQTEKGSDFKRSVVIVKATICYTTVKLILQ